MKATGIVRRIDSFRELRKKNFNIEKDIKNKCFICELDKDTCEKNNKNFKEHCEKEHFIWDYAYYMITLRMKDVQDLNAVNSRCKELISAKPFNYEDSEEDKTRTNKIDEDFKRRLEEKRKKKAEEAQKLLNKIQ